MLYAKGDSHPIKPLCIIFGERLANEAMKPSKLLWHMNTSILDLKTSLWIFFKGRT